MNYAQTAPAPEHSTSRIIAQTLAWVISVAALVVGFLLYFKGQSMAITAQIGASDGTITEAKDYYGGYTKGTSMVTLGSVLIAVSILALVLLFARVARSRIVVAPVSMLAEAPSAVSAVSPSDDADMEDADLFEDFGAGDGEESSDSDDAAGTASAEILVSDEADDAAEAQAGAEEIVVDVIEEDNDAAEGTSRA
ncbi:MAG: hypothetical protein LKJ57_02565 [Ancrocorticia sp.]|jgi:flagellar basal body-associated protein FliL|nr:hypothetical protein [Ancrocorticia sp.]MCI1896285.1 hypothetical protein [Ancrocorticia sp.]MCI1932996.1 hypothetical protein [Ancrocorticia sp.]MCI1962680.1 hypothetical protein [Ancrocorticia sp.]MCI2002039.1 hypothetical protein [Ancrocorticia sp.]